MPVIFGPIADLGNPEGCSERWGIENVGEPPARYLKPFNFAPQPVTRARDVIFNEDQYLRHRRLNSHSFARIWPRLGRLQERCFLKSGNYAGR